MVELNDTWSVYFHDPHDFNWDISSYIFVAKIKNVDEFIEFFNTFKELLYNGMFFIMRNNITPRWEDCENKKGGCFSFKVCKYLLHNSFFETCSLMLGEKLGKNIEYSININGISICPKKNYYIVRIWIKNCAYASFNYYNISTPKFSTLMYKNHSEK